MTCSNSNRTVLPRGLRQIRAGMTERVSRPRAQHRARHRPGGLAVHDGLAPVDQHPDHPGRGGKEAGRSPGQVVDEAGGIRAHRGRVEDEEVGAIPSANRPRSRIPKRSAGWEVIICTARSTGTSWRLRRQSPRNAVG